jgi:hypothetical protein
MLGKKMAQKNENIYLFIVNDSYSRPKQQTFSTTARALEDICGQDQIKQSFGQVKNQSI